MHEEQLMPCHHNGPAIAGSKQAAELSNAWHGSRSMWPPFVHLSHYNSSPTDSTRCLLRKPSAFAQSSKSIVRERLHSNHVFPAFCHWWHLRTEDEAHSNDVERELLLPGEPLRHSRLCGWHSALLLLAFTHTCVTVLAYSLTRYCPTNNTALLLRWMSSVDRGYRTLSFNPFEELDAFTAPTDVAGGTVEDR